MKPKLISTALVASGLIGAASQVWALTPATEGTPFQIVGHIQKFKLFTAAEMSAMCPGVDPLLVGAKLTVNGIEVIIPCRKIITMPATYLTPKDIFDFNKNPAESGLALDDSTPPLAAFEATLTGNIVNVATLTGTRPTHVAGLVRISQQSLNLAGGYINTIDADGTMHVGGPTPSPATDARVRINDSEGRFGLQTSFLGQGAKPANVPNLIAITEDGRFTADTGNQTIHSRNGYPMCLPRGGVADSDCPASNRPSQGGRNLTFFVMGPNPLPPPAPGDPAIPNCPITGTGCDPAKQAPFVVGDYINYSGTLAKDTGFITGENPQGLYISAHTIDAAVAIYTNGGKVAYLYQKVSLVGTGIITTDTIINPLTIAPINQEVAPRTIKVEGFTTDQSRNVEIYAAAVDPCTGNKIGGDGILVGTVQPLTVPFGRFRFIITRRGVPKKRAILATTPPTFNVAAPVLEIRVKLAGVANVPVAHGLTAGQFDAPVEEYIFAENTFQGDPLIPNNFHRFDFLAQGSGPLTTAGRPKVSPLVVRQLVPWPGQAGFGPPTLTPATCP